MKDFIKYLVDAHYEVLFIKGVIGANKTPCVMLSPKTPEVVCDEIEFKATDLNLHVMMFNNSLTITE